MNDYYPFGLTMPGRSSNSANPNDDYKFTGYERDDETGLTLDYANARTYDPIIGRFLQVDPMLEFSSPYTYVGNNPLNLIDPTGMYSQAIATIVRNQETNEEIEIDDGYDFVFVVSNDEFNEIKESGSIKGTSSYNRWFWEAVAYSMTVPNSDHTIDKLLQFFIYDPVGDALSSSLEEDYHAAALALFLSKVKKGREGYKLIKKLIKHGKKGKMPTPNLNRDQFKPGNKPGELIHKKTGAIYRKSDTSHGNVNNTGDQWKVYPKGTKEFGKTSKTTGKRVTIDGIGN